MYQNSKKSNNYIYQYFAMCELITSIVRQYCKIIERLIERRPGDEVELIWQCIQNGGTFHSFHEEEKGELLAKNIAAEQPNNSTDDICYFENICRSEQPYIS